MIHRAVKIKDVAEVNPRLATNSKPDMDELVSFVPMAGVSEKSLSIEAPVDRPYSEVSKGFTPFQRGDIIIAKITPCFENGKMAYTNNLPQKLGFGSTEFHVLRPGDALNGGYLFHLLRGPYVRRAGEMKMKGAAGQRRVPAEFFANLIIPLPPLPEQKRIAAILDAADALRAKRRESFAQLDTLIQSTFLNMFGDPVTNPKGWEQKRLGSICDVGSSKRVFVNELVEAGVPFYRGTEVGQLGDGQSVEPSLFITKEHYERLKAQSGVPCKGDLLLPSICPDGRIYLVGNDEPFYFKDGRVLWIKSGSLQINSVFLRYHLKRLFFADYSKIASGTTFAELKIFALKDLVVHVPPVHQQERFAAIVESIERQKARMRSHLAELDTLFTSLQSRVFKGNLCP
ncbi:MAG: restriction endonuclease subunit S [Deltaproteobacteria bacterium]|nr:restriction endonuclease subunit S [Deltaproteobacteria bacterium]